MEGIATTSCAGLFGPRDKKRLDECDFARNPITLLIYTVGALPVAADHSDVIVFVSEETNGPVTDVSDGIDRWRTTDRAAVAQVRDKVAVRRAFTVSQFLDDTTSHAECAAS